MQVRRPGGRENPLQRETAVRHARDGHSLYPSASCSRCWRAPSEASLPRPSNRSTPLLSLILPSDHNRRLSPPLNITRPGQWPLLVRPALTRTASSRPRGGSPSTTSCGVVA
ncbi:hypothetical protein BJX96DRAFT_147681 [Aspergillus floccosus]